MKHQLRHFWFLGFLLSAQAAADPRTEIPAALEALLAAGQVPSTCPAPKAAPSCSFQGVCNRLAENRNRPVLYEDAQGNKIYNDVYATQVSNLITCGTVKGVYTKTAGATYDANEYPRWLLEQPAEVQLAMFRIMQSYSPLPQGFQRPAPVPNESQVDAKARLLTAIGAHFNFPATPALANATRKYAEDMVKKQSARERDFDLSKLPAWARELFLDPFVTPSVLGMSPTYADPAQAIVKQKRTELESQFGALVGRMKGVLEAQKQRHPERAAAITAMVDRLTPPPELKFADYGSEIDTYCTTPNAFYSPEVHKIWICPQNLAAGAEGLLWLIGHELGHAVDSCTMTFQLNKVAYEGEPQFSVNDIKKSLEENPSEFTGTIEHSVQSPAVAPADFPLNEVLSCLQQAGSLEIRRNDPAEIIRTIERERDRKRREGTLTAADEARLNSAKQTATAHSTCSGLPGGTQEGEAFADWLATESLAGTPAPTDPLMAVGQVLASSCPNIAPEVNDSINAVLEAMECVEPQAAQVAQDNSRPVAYTDMAYLQNLHQAHGDEHSHWVDRFDRLLMANPRMREQLGCGSAPSDGVKYCAP